MTTSEIGSTFGPLISWIFLPGLATSLILRFVYQYRILTLPNNAVQAELHKKRIRTLVILSYLFYTIYSALFNRPVNFYELLNVSTDNDTEAIRKSFRKLARVHHPDKTSGGLKDEMFFINLRRGHDCLVEPTKRMAYDRFGSVILDWTEAITLKDFFTRGLQGSLAFYVINPALFGFIHWINGQRIINYWQFSLLLLLLSMELSLILNPTYPWILSFLPSQTTQHDLISALHATQIAITLASNHLADLLPALKGDAANWQNRTFDKDINEMKDDLEGFRLAMLKMESHWRALAFESERALGYSLLPLRPAQRDSAQTKQETAAVIAAGLSTPQSREPTSTEETYIHLLSRLIFRARLKAVPGIFEEKKAKMQTVQDDKAEEKSVEDADGSEDKDRVNAQTAP